METRQSVFIASSLDGFIARPDGDVDWLHDDYGENPAGDYGYTEFFDSVDAVVMGRKSFEKVLSFGDEWFYGSKKVVVLSSGSIRIPERLSETVSSMSGAPDSIVKQLAAEGFFHLYVDGGNTIQQFLKAGFIQEMTITTIPILLGDGIPLFGFLSESLKLELLKSESFSNGFVLNRYRVKQDVNL